MIIKSFEIDKIKKTSSKFLLLYGDNQGLKDEVILVLKSKKKINSDVYYENEILKDVSNFTNAILSKSFFDNEKFVIIKKISDKILPIIEFILEKNIEEITIVLEADILEKKSKIRNLFEKDKNLVCIPFYPDNYQSLNLIVTKYFNDKKISISNETINLMIDRANGQRKFLKIELDKIDNYVLNKKKINLNEIKKITNLGNNHEISDLVDTCLSKNNNKLNNIINENVFSSDDVILIIRVLLAKAKRLLKIKSHLNSEKDINTAITSYKPPIFWKDKDLVKIQLKFWSKNEILKLVNEINELEMQVKKNVSLAVIILIDFILKKSEKTSNSSL